MRANTVALSALTFATVTVALPMVPDVHQEQSNGASSSLAARQLNWPNTNSLLPVPSTNLNIPGLLQPGLTNGLNNNLLVGVLGNGPDSLPGRLLSTIAAVNPFAGLLASTLANVLASIPAAIISGSPVQIEGLIPGALAGITAGLPPVINPAGALQGLLPGVLTDIAVAVPTQNPLEGLLPGLLTGLPTGLGLALPTPVVPTPRLPVASAASITPVAIPTTVLQQVPALVPSTLVTTIATVVPTRVVQAVPTNVLGLLQPILPINT